MAGVVDEKMEGAAGLMGWSKEEEEAKLKAPLRSASLGEQRRLEKVVVVELVGVVVVVLEIDDDDDDEVAEVQDEVEVKVKEEKEEERLGVLAAILRSDAVRVLSSASS